MIHCPECKQTLSAPYGLPATVNKQRILMLYCPHCGCYLGAVKV